MIFSKNEMSFGIPDDVSLLRAIARREKGSFHLMMEQISDAVVVEEDWEREHQSLVNDIVCAMRFVGTPFEAFLVFKGLRPTAGHHELAGFEWCFQKLRESRHLHLIEIAKSMSVRSPIETPSLVRLRPSNGSEDVRTCLAIQPEALLSKCTCSIVEYVDGDYLRDSNGSLSSELASWTEIVEVLGPIENETVISELRQFDAYPDFIEKDWIPAIEPDLLVGEDEVLAKLRARRSMHSLREYSQGFLNCVLT
jgi:hypothetical protein